MEFLKKLGIEQDTLSSRMHFLRWEYPTTLNYLSEAGIDNDNTLGYADKPGFRCGTCTDYPAYDALEQKILNIRIQPLIVMDNTILDKDYIGLGISAESEKEFSKLIDICKAVKGSFSLLWHNCNFKNQLYFSFYKKLILS